MKYISLVAVAAAFCLVSCSTSSSDPLTSLLDSPASSEVEKVSEIIPDTKIEAESVRFVGLDSVGLQYFVGKASGSDVCLLVFEEQTAQWGSSCGQPGYFSFEFDNTTAWLNNSTYAEHVAEENVAGIVFLKHSGS